MPETRHQVQSESGSTPKAGIQAHDPNPKNIAKEGKVLTNMFPWLKTRGCEVTLHLTTYRFQVAEIIGTWDAGQHTYFLFKDTCCSITGYVAKPESPGFHLILKRFVFMVVCLNKFIVKRFVFIMVCLSKLIVKRFVFMIVCLNKLIVKRFVFMIVCLNKFIVKRFVFMIVCLNKFIVKRFVFMTVCLNKFIGFWVPSVVICKGPGCQGFWKLDVEILGFGIMICKGPGCQGW